LGDALGIGNRIIRRAGGVGNAVQVATADAVAALGVGATIGDAAVTDSTADGLFADALLPGSFVDVDFLVQLGGCCGGLLF